MAVCGGGSGRVCSAKEVRKIVLEIIKYKVLNVMCYKYFYSTGNALKYFNSFSMHRMCIKKYLVMFYSECKKS